MGENSRYERYAHRFDAETEAEASALRVVAGLVERGAADPGPGGRRSGRGDPAGRGRRARGRPAGAAAAAAAAHGAVDR
ncbi:hypothetical protein Ae406Ps2_6093c [Pseudonocardia sp. Ae406_Ps2]|nr:hypothetical protein Ae406Ps2_6093c [Pseudonocardia sp. Ae406_Ps2]OLM09702.1 hypothetical protein Ae706Ps2_6164 [Pseudonocardia sp. Ae706_Ps2]